MVEKINSIRILLLIAGFVMMNGCRSKDQVVNWGDTETPFFISMERTACFGECPEYIFSINHKGTFVYEGFRNVMHIGPGSAEVSKDDLEQLRARLSQINWSAHQDEYECNVADLPSVILIVKSKRYKKRIKINCEWPAELETFFNWFDTLNKKYMPDAVEAPDAPEGQGE
jgi:hypothetical protein